MTAGISIAYRAGKNLQHDVSHTQAVLAGGQCQSFSQFKLICTTPHSTRMRTLHVLKISKKITQLKMPTNFKNTI